MEIDITVEDAKACTRPFTVRLFKELLLGDDLIEYVCLENQKFEDCASSIDSPSDISLDSTP